MKKTMFIRSGQILSATAAIVIAGCLIKNEQNASPTGNVNPKTIEETPVEILKHADNTANTVSSDLANAVVEEVSMIIDDKHTVISKLSAEEFTELLEKANREVTEPTFFNTSKSGLPSVEETTHLIHIQKKEHVQVVHYSYLHSQKWSMLKNDLARFHAEKTSTQPSTCETITSIIYTKDNNAPIELHKQQNQSIRDTVLEIDQERNTRLILFSSSKSLPPKVESPEYKFTVTKEGKKEDLSPLYLDEKQWDTLRKDILNCMTILSMEYLYEISP